MASIIIELSGGLVNEIYSNLTEPLNVQVYDLEDVSDPEHAYLYAACDYARRFGGLKPHFGRNINDLDRPWSSLERDPESATLVSELCRASSPEGIRNQELDAAFLAGYLESLGEYKVFMDFLLEEKRVSPEVRHQMVQVFDRQLEKYYAFAELINTAERYDSENQVPAAEMATKHPKEDD